MRAMANDTAFLAYIKIIDYSILVGVDEEQKVGGEGGREGGFPQADAGHGWKNLSGSRSPFVSSLPPSLLPSLLQALVVGIIDYMRQYDIIKKMERMGKSVGMIAGQAEPTVIQPQPYRSRFQAAMERYFAKVPDKWTWAA